MQGKLYVPVNVERYTLIFLITDGCLPRNDVIGYNYRIDWNALMGRSRRFCIIKITRRPL